MSNNGVRHGRGNLLLYANTSSVFQQAKTEYRKTAKVPSGWKQDDLDRGFITTGPWAYCRHPNFSAEQTIWLVLYQWSCYATQALYSWTGLGSMFLIMLFQGSTWLTELITAGKYPEYKHYQRQVGMQLPSLTPYKTPEPKVIRTSELAKRQQQKTKQK
jgi:steroid 5-alpha reductase family enzyme